jgi:hypothetical protein
MTRATDQLSVFATLLLAVIPVLTVVAAGF